VGRRASNGLPQCRSGARKVGWDGENAIEADSSGVGAIVGNPARQVERTFQSVSGATEIYAQTSPRATEGLPTLATEPTVAANGENKRL
jgi:hypothetical protein